MRGFPYFSFYSGYRDRLRVNGQFIKLQLSIATQVLIPWATAEGIKVMPNGWSDQLGEHGNERKRKPRDALCGKLACCLSATCPCSP